jgi:hypothetical protein
MKTWQLIILRAYNHTLGRTALGAKLLRKALVIVVVGKSGQDKYAASSEFFDMRDLNKRG